MRSLLADPTPLRVSPDFRRMWAGLSVSSIGSQLTVVAVSLQVYDLTRSSLAVGLTGMFALVPLIVFGLYGGALLDHADRRTVAVGSAVVLWLSTGGLALQAWLDLRSVGLLYGLIALQSAASAFNSPARQAIVPRLLPARLMPAANAWMGITWNLAMTLGPLLGAGLVAGLGFEWAYTVDAAMFTAALWALFRLPPIPPERDPEHSGRTRVGLGAVLDGLRFLATRPNVRTTFELDLAAMVLAMPRVLLPAVGVLYLGGGETTTGVLIAAIAFGGIGAGVFSGALGRVRHQGRAVVWAITGWAVAIVAFGVTLVAAGPTHPGTVRWVPLAIAVAALAAAGASDAVSAVFRQTILQTATPDAMRGRLQGIFIVVVAGGPRLGDVVLGGQAAWLGEAGAALVGGLVCLVVVWLIVRVRPRFWAYDAHDPQP